MKKISLTTILVFISLLSQAQVDKPVPPVYSTGTLVITSSPEKCSVVIDGVKNGKTTPLTLNKKVGTYKVTCEHDGYLPKTISVKVNRGKTTKCNLKLEKGAISAKDSILLLAEAFISKTTFLPAESTLDEEGKGILTFQKDVIKYASHIKILYTDIVGETLPKDATDESLAMLTRGNLLKILQSQNLEKSCLDDALKMITVMSQKDGVAKQGFNKELVVQVIANQNISPVPNNNSDLILSLTKELKFQEALKVISDGLLEPQVLARYKSFLICWNNFYNVADLRLEEIKNSSPKE